MTTPPSDSENAFIDIIEWNDPLVAASGFPISDTYVELFWLPILGPTATWLIRRCAHGLTEQPQGYTVDMADLAQRIGVAYSLGRHNPFARALHRCIMFGAAQQIALHPRRTLAVRTTLPALPQRHLARLPEQLQIAHHDWVSHLVR